MRFSIVLGVVLLAGCATIEDKMADAINRYCEEVTQTERELIRERINAKIQPNGVRVECAGD